MNSLNSEELKFVAYIRKSTDREDKQIQSLESQKDILERIAKYQNVSIIEWVEESCSAKVPNKRPLFEMMLKDIGAEKYNAILTLSPDRLSRNAVDSGFLAELMTVGKLKTVVTRDTDFEANPMGVMMLQFLMLNAKLENMIKADKVKDGLRGKLEKGWLPAVAPQGYLNTKLPEKGDNKIVIDPERFPMIRKLWDMMLTGAYTIPEMVEIADIKWGYRSVKRKRLGATPISRSGLYEIFSNPFYYGYFLYKGEFYKGSHDPMVSKKEFDRVQEILGRTNKRRPKSHISTYAGLIRCSYCGCAITATHKEKYYPKTDNRVLYDYYHCTKRRRDVVCNQRYITESDLKDQIVEITSSIEIPVEFKDWATTYLIEKANYEANTSLNILESQQSEYSGIEKNLSDLLSMRMNEEITAGEYATKRKELTSRRDDLKELLEDSEKARDRFKAEVMETFNFAHSAREKFEYGGLEEKREVLSKLGQNLLLKDGKLDIDLKKSLLAFKKGKEPNYMENKQSELVDVAVVTAKYGVSEPANLSWLPSPEILSECVDRVIQVFNNSAQVTLSLNRWATLANLI